MRERRKLADFSVWETIFERKVGRGETLPWNDAYRITAEERACIATSVQQFEIGENAQGRSFLAAARVYAEKTGDWDYVRALQGFIREEQRHSSYLRRFMLEQDIPVAESHWVDSTFRGLRKLAGLETFIVVLVTAEIIATSYYRALGRATRSPLLRAICREILRDEGDHLCFQGNALRRLRTGRGRLRNAIVRGLHNGLLLGTCLVVWHSHDQVYKRGGYTFGEFVRSGLRGIRSFDRTAAQPLESSVTPAVIRSVDSAKSVGRWLSLNALDEREAV